MNHTDLQNQVIDHWENEGVMYFTHETQSGPNIPPGGFSETFIKPEYQEILDDPQQCAEELGYNSVEEWQEAQ